MPPLSRCTLFAFIYPLSLIIVAFITIFVAPFIKTPLEMFVNKEFIDLVLTLATASIAIPIVFWCLFPLVKQFNYHASSISAPEESPSPPPSPHTDFVLSNNENNIPH